MEIVREALLIRVGRGQVGLYQGVEELVVAAKVKLQVDQLVDDDLATKSQSCATNSFMSLLNGEVIYLSAWFSTAMMISLRNSRTRRSMRSR